VGGLLGLDAEDGFVPAARLKRVKRPGLRAARAFWLIVIRKIEVCSMATIAHASAARVSKPSSPSRIVAAPCLRLALFSGVTL